MHDIRAIRDNPAAFDAAMGRRGLGPKAAEILRLDANRVALVGQIQDMQTRKNADSKKVGVLMREGKKEAAEQLRAELAGLARSEVPVAADPRDPVAARRTRRGHVAHHDHEAATALLRHRCDA